MCFRLAPFHYVAFIGDRAVVLDTLSDRYRLLGPTACRSLRALECAAPDDASIVRLQALGIVEPGPAAEHAEELSTPVGSAIETRPIDTDRFGTWTVTTAIALAVLSLKTRGLAATLQRAAECVIIREGDPERLIAASQAYARQRFRLPLRHICLPDSLALHRLLVKRGLLASLVIGVRLDPFGAHCWVQAHDMVLNDSCDTVSGFTPILVL